MSISVLIPAHNELKGVGDTIESVLAQTVPADEIIVIADNCTDATGLLASSYGVEVFRTVNNTNKKAGALNQWFDVNLGLLTPGDLVMVMDADSTLDNRFLETACGYIEQGYDACGGVFSGKSGGGFVGALQRNEYARYGRDVERRNGKALVLTGTATMFAAGCLSTVLTARRDGRLPSAPIAQVYDVEADTEDNELTFALLHTGHQIIAPATCRLETEVMDSWGDLLRQRYRWKRGAIENNVNYGLNDITAKYWALQVWGLLGIIVTATYLFTLAHSLLVSHRFNLGWLWIVVTMVFVVERVVTVRQRGLKQQMVAAVLLIEMPYDLFLQAIHLKAIAGALLRTKTAW